MKVYKKFKINNFINKLILMRILKELSFHRNKLGKVNHFVINEEGEWVNVLIFKGVILIEKTKENPKSLSEIEDFCEFISDLNINEKLVNNQIEFSKHLIAVMR